MLSACRQGRANRGRWIGVLAVAAGLIVLCGLAASAALSLSVPEYGDCGQVTIDGFASDNPPSITWDWGDETASQSFFPATHEYATNGTYTVTATAQGTGDTDQVTVTITNAGGAGCDCSVCLQPASIALRDGTTSGRFEVEVRDGAGAIVSTAGVPIAFSSSAPAIVSVDTTGQVTSTGFGAALVTASVDGYRDVSGWVYAGSFRVTPPILLLSLEPTLCTGVLAAEILNADGTPVDLTGKTFAFQMGNHVASVDPETGVVTALAPPALFGDTPAIHATLDGVYSNNTSIIRVTSTTLGLTPSAHEHGTVSFWFAPEVTTQDYEAIYDDHDVGRITDLAYQFESDLTGVVTFSGDIQFLVNDPGHDSDGTVPCGLSGNPVRLGTNVDSTIHNSCFIVAFPPEVPQWGIYLHEMGHNFTWQSSKFGEFCGAGGANSNFTYSEGLATACGIYAAQRLDDESESLGLSAGAVAEIKESVGYFASWDSLADYVSAGADYSSIDPDVLDDMVSTIAHEFGFESLYRLYSLFLPQHEGFPFDISSDTEQATVFIAAMSAATGADLRSRFHDTWGFPVDNAYYTLVYPPVRRLVLQRGPELHLVEDTAATFRVSEEGDALVDGAVFGSAYLSGSADVAEWVSLTGHAGAGDVLELDRAHPGSYRLTQTPCSRAVAGVVSTEPGVVLGGAGSEGMALLALSGIVPVKVTNEGGPIQPGDLLVSSSTPGYAMRWAGAEPCPCAIVGKALEAMTGEQGVISVLLTAH